MTGARAPRSIAFRYAFSASGERRPAASAGQLSNAPRRMSGWPVRTIASNPSGDGGGATGVRGKRSRPAASLGAGALSIGLAAARELGSGFPPAEPLEVFLVRRLL